MSIGNRLRKLRTENRFTLSQVARQVGVPVSTYRDWEYGKAIQGEPYAKLAQAFGVSIEELLGGEKALQKPEMRSDILGLLLNARKNLDLAIEVARALS
ncbi:MAG: helix-turn-helix transcriptional regulator [Oligoflexia bacterium]|nr:helix-turn-helix transcriptional regulator [Oligoflexia bacterium]